MELALQRLQMFSDNAGKAVGLLGLRLFIAYEFFEAGLEKWNGENWFAHIADKFPWPFSALPPDFNWQLSMWTELVAPVLIALGLFTRGSAVALMILTAVAWYAVHAGNGYNVSQNGFKLPLIYLITLLPLVLQGAGALSLDHIVRRFLVKP
ncbi:MAG: DoxX family protein [Cardiobacteriaceae bacterium]|nr:DoxX family protein [Cardiobacteriaceae bacterium]